MKITTVVLVMALLPTSVSGQTGGTVRVIQTAAVVENPRGDAFVVGTAPTGMVLEVLEVAGNWYRVAPPADKPGSWRRGWIQANYLEVLTPGVATTPTGAPAPPPVPSEPLLIRGFGQAGGTLFSAKDSFDAILGSGFGGVYGGGGQVAFGNGLFAQVGVDRFRKTGSRLLVSGEQLFRLGIPHIITVRPIDFTVGYRDPRPRSTIGYAGVGIGLHAFEERTPDLQGAGDVKDTKIGYHVLGGAEYRIARWVWLAGEVQWSAVPKLLGEHGVSAVFEEDDLGGTTFRFKVLFGR